MKLFLDDIRQPKDVCYIVPNPGIYWTDDWVIVKNYPEFCRWIKSHGLPEIVSFDHDLAESHYDIDFEEWNNFTADQLGVEETGLDCAKWLVDYCEMNGFDLPEYYVHSANPVGRRVIKKYLDDSVKHLKSI